MRDALVHQRAVLAPPLSPAQATRYARIVRLYRELDAIADHSTTAKNPEGHPRRDIIAAERLRAAALIAQIRTEADAFTAMQEDAAYPVAPEIPDSGRRRRTGDRPC